MTGNKITLYKVPWAFGSIRQPYFLSDTARNNFFNGLTDFVQAVENGVGIKIGYNYEIECVCNIDITVAQDYNFGIITYNNHDYYADVIDMEMVNVNRTRIQFRRNAIIENTNYLQHFKNFTISRMTLKPDTDVIVSADPETFEVTTKKVLDQTANKKFLCTDYFRTKFTEIPIDIYYGSNPNNNKVKAIAAIVLIRTKEDFSSAFSSGSLYGEETGYSLEIIPLPYLEESKFFENGSTSYPYKTFTVHYRKTGQTDSVSYTWETVSIYKSFLPLANRQMNNSPWYELLSQESPYTCQAMFTKILVRYDENDPSQIYLPYTYYGINDHPGLSGHHACGFLLDDTDVYNAHGKPNNDEYWFSVGGDITVNDVSKAYFSKLKFKFYNSSDSFEINLRDYISKYTNPLIGGPYQTCTLTFYIKQVFGMLGTQWLIKIKQSNDTSTFIDSIAIINQPYSHIISLNDSTNITVEASANFNANNRYYMAMANNAIDQGIVNGAIQGGVQALTGITQMGAGFATSAAGEDGTNMGVMGLGNIYRSIGTFASTFVNAHYQKQAAILAKRNEETKPDTVKGSFASQSAFNSMENIITVILEEPFEEDFQHWLNDSKIYGYECELFEETLDVESLTDEGNFSLSAVAEVADDTLNARDYTEMYEFLKECNYKVYS